MDPLHLLNNQFAIQAYLFYYVSQELLFFLKYKLKVRPPPAKSLQLAEG